MHYDMLWFCFIQKHTDHNNKTSIVLLGDWAAQMFKTIRRKCSSEDCFMVFRLDHRFFFEFFFFFFLHFTECFLVHRLTIKYIFFLFVWIRDIYRCLFCVCTFSLSYLSKFFASTDAAAHRIYIYWIFKWKM